MGITSVTILEETTSAEASEQFNLGPFPSVTVYCTGLAGAETATVQFKNPIDGTWNDYNPGGGVLQLTSSVGLADVYQTAAVGYRINKSATASPVGVAVSGYLP